MLTKVSKHKSRSVTKPTTLKDYVLIVYPSVKISKDEFNDIVDMLDEVAKIKGKQKKKLTYADMVQLLLTLDVIDGDSNNDSNSIQKNMSINMGWNPGESKTIYWFALEPKFNTNIGLIRHNIDKYLQDIALDRVLSSNNTTDFSVSRKSVNSFTTNPNNNTYPFNDEKQYDDNDNVSQMINVMNADRIHTRIALDLEHAKMYLEYLESL